MKKVKIMLTSIALIAVVGGALAFKAKYSVNYCTAAVNSNGTCPATCPNLIEDQRFNDVAVGVPFVCTTTSFATPAQDCKDAQGFAPACSTITHKLVSDQ